MPVLIIYGMPKKKQPSQAALLELVKDLQANVSRVLNIDPDAVSVFFPTDCLIEGLGEELICRVDGLFENPKRTIGLRRKLADEITSTLSIFAKRHILQCRLVETMIARFDQDKDGFSSRTLK
jgi:hypothetical protein